LAIEADEYRTYKDFRYVLDTAESEINNKTSLSVSYRGVKTANVTTHVQFVVRENPDHPALTSVVEELDASSQLDENESELVQKLIELGFRQNPAQTIKTYGYERCLANYKLSKTSIEQAQASGKPIKNPGGFAYDMIRRDVATSQNQTKTTQKPNIAKIAAKLVEAFENERATCLGELWNSISDDRQVELHDLMRFSITEFARQQLESQGWQGLLYTSERNKILLSEYPDHLPKPLQTLQAYVEDRELFSGEDRKLKTSVMKAAQELF
jgi:hypothetical protein